MCDDGWTFQDKRILILVGYVEGLTCRAPTSGSVSCGQPLDIEPGSFYACGAERCRPARSTRCGGRRNGINGSAPQRRRCTRLLLPYPGVIFIVVPSKASGYGQLPGHCIGTGSPVVGVITAPSTTAARTRQSAHGVCPLHVSTHSHKEVCPVAPPFCIRIELQLDR